MKRIISAILLCCALALSAKAQPAYESGGPDPRLFKDTPDQYRPRVWWHWMNGNISKEGIRKDILWMHRAGIVGFHCFDAGLGTPQIVGRRLVYMTPEWKDAFNYALDLADSLGMEVTITSSPGWSVTGGPWVEENDAEKKVTWQEMTVEGGRTFSGKLPEPFIHCGPYQDERLYKDSNKYDWYRDICVIAVKCPPQDTARILYSKVKAGFEMDYKVSDHFPTPDTDDCTAIKDVVDITDHFKDGILTWKAPEGKWKIFRFGCNLLGRVNGPASPEATGLEVDKLNAAAVKRYYEKYLGMYQEATGGRLGKSIKCLMIDSYESGKGTWTDDMEEQFLRRRGYSLRRWLPVLTGQIIGSASESERFLFDWRQTLGELFAECHYDSVNGILAPYGMIRHSEAHEERQAFVGDGMMVKRHADIPMSAFWVRYNAGWHSSYPGSDADIRESSSVAHIYGQNICAAESFTTNGKIGKWDGFGAYKCYPGNLKPVADAAMAQGLNRFIIHSCVHQPVDDKVPGLGLGTYGQWFNRNDTWAEEAKPWTDYLARSSYMLQLGKNVADIAYFYGEDKNITGRFYDERVRIPDGYSYDFVNGDIILNVLEARNGALETESGMRYSVLAIDREVRYMSMPVLKRIEKFADAGVMICGPRPLSCANLKGSDREFLRIVSRIWDSGRLNVREDGDIAGALAAAGVSKDVEGYGMDDRQCLLDSVKFVHRRLKDGDIYWISNNSASEKDMLVSLRTSGFRPEIWKADYGTMENAEYRISDGRTLVRLHMTPDDSQFIVLTDHSESLGGFSQDADASSHADVETDIPGPWNLSFQSGRGAPEKLVMENLKSLTECDDPGIRYFSGTVTYSTEFDCSKPSGVRICLDLGKVGNMARICLNGRDLGLLWHAPYVIDVTESLKDGRNELEIAVTNSWANRLIGDKQKDSGDHVTWTATQFYLEDSPLVPSGLIGPVRILGKD